MPKRCKFLHGKDIVIEWAENRNKSSSTTLSSLDGLVAPGVHAYILRHKLYRKVNWRMVRARGEHLKDLVRRSDNAPAPTPPSSRKK